MSKKQRHFPSGYIFSRDESGRSPFGDFFNTTGLRRVCRYFGRNAPSCQFGGTCGPMAMVKFADLIGATETSGTNQPRLSLPPIALPANWGEYVQTPQTEKEQERLELARIRKSIETGLPYGTTNWLQKTIKLLGLESLITPKGRRKKKKEFEQ